MSLGTVNVGRKGRLWRGSWNDLGRLDEWLKIRDNGGVQSISELWNILTRRKVKYGLSCSVSAKGATLPCAYASMAGLQTMWGPCSCAEGRIHPHYFAPAKIPQSADLVSLTFTLLKMTVWRRTAGIRSRDESRGLIRDHRSYCSGLYRLVIHPHSVT